ncbi:TRAP transporter substrate-binding protein [Prosthecomicrobium pneumaticum]|uniref:TRAP-type mannitol/chloroaromatic compound transport system substrate-binding protein n=1 Tax=Prosthecomicrobium pneumaticum TaxID=81895 RepID=A0A7W9L2V7_9HYPH|nr:TRAP transporter substrate-binding protein [Prosthecomicrobium pneumaticum]MBB5753876.1 TRAP-type mannitol/chloroaromatic compound transport system substrate-binding protein [Prosthecomicrobium pneumaticum]
MTGRGDGANRRTALRLGLLGAAGALAAPAVVRADTPVIWRMATAWPADAPGLGTAAASIAQTIGVLSGGRLKVEVHPAGVLGPAMQVFDLVSSGAAELGHGSPYYWQARDPAFNFFTGVPFGLTATEHAGWLAVGGGQALWEKAYEPFGVVPFYAGNSGVQAAGWFRREIRTPDDLRGLVIRISGLGGEVMKRLGATPVLLGSTELYAALDSGTIDAAEWIGPWNDLDLRLARVAPFYYMPSFHEIGAALELIVGRKALDGLPDDLRQVIATATQAGAAATTAAFAGGNILAFDRLARENVRVARFPEGVVTALAEASAAVLADLAKASPMATEVHDAFIAFRAQASAYAAASEGPALAWREAAIRR